MNTNDNIEYLEEIISDVKDLLGLSKYDHSIYLKYDRPFIYTIGFTTDIKIDPEKLQSSFFEGLANSLQESADMKALREENDRLKNQIIKLEKYKEYYDMHYAMMNGKLK